MCVHPSPALGAAVCLLLRYAEPIAFIVPHFISFCQVVQLLLRAPGFMAAIFLTVSEIKYQANNRLPANVNCTRKAILFRRKSYQRMLSLEILRKQSVGLDTLCTC